MWEEVWAGKQGQQNFPEHKPGSFPHLPAPGLIPKPTLKNPKHAVGTGNGGKQRDNNRENTQAGIEFEFGAEKLLKNGKSGKWRRKEMGENPGCP